MSTAETETPAEELARLRLEDAERERESLDEEQAFELEALRLVSQLSKELGKRGKDFEVVTTPFGVFGVKKPDAQGVAQWDKAIAADASTDRLIMILRHYIVPEAKALEFHQVATDRPGIVKGQNSVGMAFLGLTGAVKFDAKKK